MTKSIRWRMVTIFVLLVVIVMIVSGTLIVYQTRSYENNLIKSKVTTLANAIYKGVKSEEPITEIEADFKAVILTEREYLTNKKVFILDHQGKVVYTPSVLISEDRFYTAQVMAALSDKIATKFDEQYFSGDDTRYIGYAKNIKKDGEVIFVIYVVASTSEVQDKVEKMVVIIIYAVLLSIILSVILAFLFSSFLTKPISALTMKAREMAKGELNNPIEVFSNDEIGELTVNFNKMASSLNATLNQIASEKNKMETVITHMTDGILVFDNYGLLIHKNPAAVHMLKLGNVQSFKDVFEGKIDIPFSHLLQNVEYTTQKIAISMDEEYYSLDLARYIDVDETTLGLISVIQDITEHKKLENMQKEFVANVSHELRTPLTTIKSYAETLLEGTVDDLETTSHFLGVINNESDRMTALVQDLLELSKLDNEKINLDEKVINLSKLVFHSVENYRIHTNKKSQELTMEGIEGEYLIIGDINRVEQVLKNLLSNAVKYSDENASVHVKLSSNIRYHKISVTDTGMGIPEEDLSHIFERFYRVDKARSRAMGGTGLGLAIAKEIMTLHHGKIQVESKLNVGTTFTLLLPVYNDDVEGI